MGIIILQVLIGLCKYAKMNENVTCAQSNDESSWKLNLFIKRDNFANKFKKSKEK